METRKIPSSEIERAAVENNLADRPSGVSRYGEGSLTPREIKAAYDRLPRLVCSYLNAFIEACENASVLESVPSGIREGHMLSNLLADIKNGELAEYMTFFDGSTLADLYKSYRSIRTVKGRVTLLASDWQSNTISVDIGELLADDIIFFSPSGEDDMEKLSHISVFALAAKEGGSVTFKTDKHPTDDIYLDFAIVR